MWICQQCNKENEDTDAVCLDCGNARDDIIESEIATTVETKMSYNSKIVIKDNMIDAYMIILAWVVLIGGIFYGLIVGLEGIFFETQAAVAIWIPSALIWLFLLGFAQIIYLLRCIAKSLNR